MPKHDGGLRRIHHLSYPRGQSVNDHIPDGAGELRYTRFQEVLQMVIQAGRGAVILKRDVKDAFRNVPVAPQHQWLLGFSWKGKFYKETCLSFGLCTAPFIFNLFGEGLHWLLVSFLSWILCRYLDDFIAIFSAKDATPSRLRSEANAYIWLTDLLGIPRNDSKDGEGTVLVVFGIEVDTNTFTAKLPREKLEKARTATARILKEKSVSFLKMQSLVGFLSFCSQAVRLGRVFMMRLWDFVNLFPRSASRTDRKRIPAWVRQDLQWWNELLPQYNGVLFFDTINRKIVSLYTDACLYGLGGCFFEGSIFWEQADIKQTQAFRALVKGKTLPANRKLAKNPDDPSINVHEVEAILLAFQLWAPSWKRQRIKVHTDSTTAFAGLQDYTLRGPPNAPLREIFLLAAKWDIVIEPHWIEGKRNGLADALSRFDDDRLTLLSPSWQNPYNTMTLPPPSYPPHPAQQSSKD